MELGRLEEARTLYEQALAIHRERGWRQTEAIVLGNLANWHRLAGSPDEQAKKLYEESLSIHQEEQDQRNEGHVLGNLADFYHERGDLEKAAELYERALTLQRSSGNRRAEAIALGKPRPACGPTRVGSTRRGPATPSAWTCLARSVSCGSRPCSGSSGEPWPAASPRPMPSRSWEVAEEMLLDVGDELGGGELPVRIGLLLSQPRRRSGGAAAAGP